MPPFDVTRAQGDFRLKTMCYGESGTRKTTWICKAAELGFNLVYLDIEDGTKVINTQVKPEFHPNIMRIDLTPLPERAIAAEFMIYLGKQRPFVWDEQGKCVIEHPIKMDPEHSHLVIQPKKLSLRDILVVDSWTRFVDSALVRTAFDKAIDLTEVDRYGRDIYGFLSTYQSWVMHSILAFNCHMVVIGHTVTYNEYYPKKNPKDPMEQQLLKSSKIQAVSMSGNQAQKLPQYFDDMLYFYFQGDNIKISTRPNDYRIAKSRLIKPHEWMWEDLQFKHLLEASNIKYPIEPAPLEAVKYYEPGIVPEIFSDQTALTGMQRAIDHKRENKALIAPPATPAMRSLADRMRQRQQATQQPQNGNGENKDV